MTLLPQHTLTIPSKPFLLTLFGKKFQQNTKESNTLYAIIVIEKLHTQIDTSTTTLPYQIQKLISQFKEIPQKDLPNSLPPLRDIQHQIDLVLGASIPNLPHYRMSHKKNEILQGIVNDLLQKHLIRVNLRPYAIQLSYFL